MRNNNRSEFNKVLVRTLGAVMAITVILLLSSPLKGQTDWTEDLDYLKNELPYLHTNLFESLPQADFNTGIDQLKNLNGKISDAAMSIKIQQLICKLGDSHTTLDYFDKLDRVYLPIGITFYQEGLFIMGDLEDNESILGKKIIKINGHSVTSIIDSLSTLIVVDGENSKKAKIPHLITLVPLLRHFGFLGDEQKIEVETENYYGIPSKTKVKILKSDDIDYDDFSSLRISKNKDQRPSTSKNFDFVYKKDRSTLYILYNKARSRETECTNCGYDSLALLSGCPLKKALKKTPLPSFRTFADSLISVMETTPVKKIVIDLSKNSGGVSSLASGLFGRMKSLLKNNPEVKVIVIIGRRTASAAVIHALELKRQLNAIIIGEASGSKVNFYGGTDSRTLSGSCLNLKFSRGYSRNVLNPEDFDKVLTPDVIFEVRFSDKVSGIDPVYEWIKNN